jgi:hypothetical protein
MSDVVDEVSYKPLSLQPGSVVVMLFYSEWFCFYENIMLCRNCTFVIIYRSTGTLHTRAHMFIYDRSHQNLTILWANCVAKCSHSTVTVVKCCDFGLWQPSLNQSCTFLLKYCCCWYHTFRQSLRHKLVIDWNMGFLACFNF